MAGLDCADFSIALRSEANVQARGCVVNNSFTAQPLFYVLSFFSVRFLAMASLQILPALARLIWLNEIVLLSAISRHGLAQILPAVARLIWLNEIVEFYLRAVCTLTRGVVL